jgi:hypothetical protein
MGAWRRETPPEKRVLHMMQASKAEVGVGGSEEPYFKVSNATGSQVSDPGHRRRGKRDMTYRPCAVQALKGRKKYDAVVNMGHVPDHGYQVRAECLLAAILLVTWVHCRDACCIAS